MITAENSSVIQRPIDQVFAFLSDPVNEPKWQTDATAASLTSPGAMRAGRTVRMMISNVSAT